MNDFFASILRGINTVIPSYGWSIVVFTFCVRLIILPFDYKSRLSMRKTQKIQSKLAVIQKRYANDKEKLNQKTSELYKKEGINPLSSCLPMLLSMPILFAMYGAMRLVANEQLVGQVLTMLQGQEPVMESWLWIKNIWMPDNPCVSMLPDLNSLRMVPGDVWEKMITGDTLSWLISTFNLSDAPFARDNLQATMVALNAALQETSFYAHSGVLPGWTFNLLITSFSIMKDFNGLFILPLMAASSQFLMTKLQPAQPAADAQAQQQNSMSFMTWFFPLFSLWICATSNGAFSLYWMAANLFAIVETYGINKYLDMTENDAAAAKETAGEGSIK